MIANVSDETLPSLEVCKDLVISAPIEIVFEATLAELGPDSQMPDGTPMPMVLEPWPGGRWFRDLGNQAGHFWAHVQVIKPPKLLELCGPLFMSYPAINHVQYRLTEEGGGTRLKLTHRGFGQIPEEVRQGVSMGWGHGVERIREIAERLAGERKGGK